jgi:hypothetical protein
MKSKNRTEAESLIWENKTDSSSFTWAVAKTLHRQRTTKTDLGQRQNRAAMKTHLCPPPPPPQKFSTRYVNTVAESQNEKDGTKRK